MPRGVRGWVIALAVVAAIFSAIDFDYIGDGGGPWGGFAALIAFAMVGLNEELLFRGFGLASLTRLYGVRRAVFVSSLLFGLAHAVNLLLGQSVSSTFLQVIATTVIGFLLALFTIGAGSLIAAMVAHALWDFMLTSRGGESELGGVAGAGAFAPAVVWMIGLLMIGVLAHRRAMRERRAPAGPAATA
jgi:membrane protease YdiL (CAAX protease family)